MLIEELEVTSRAMPGLIQAFSANGLMDLEEGGPRTVACLFREHGEPAFLIPRDIGGGGGSLLEIAQILRVVGARFPSLSIMMTMHHHTVATFCRGRVSPLGGVRFLKRVAEARALVASAFSEGRPGADVLESSVRCTRLDSGAGFKVAGAKKPCSMAHYADFAVVGVSVALGGDETGRGMALVDRTLDGIGTTDFWPAQIFASADCHGITFHDVIVADDCVLAPRDAASASRAAVAVAHAEIAMSCLFQVLASASYLGMATRLCEIVLKRRGGTPTQRVEMLSRLETAILAVYRLAQQLEKRDCSGYVLAQSMLVAQNARAQIDAVVNASVAAMGGGGFLTSREAQYLVLASRCLAFHPPSDRVREQVVEGCYTDLV